MDDLLQELRRKALTGDVHALRTLEVAVRRFPTNGDLADAELRGLARLLVTCRFEGPAFREPLARDFRRYPLPWIVRLAGVAIDDFSPSTRREGPPEVGLDGAQFVRRLEDGVVRLLSMLEHRAFDVPRVTTIPRNRP